MSGSAGLRAGVVRALAALGAGQAPERLVVSAIPVELRRRLARPDLEVFGELAAGRGGSAVIEVLGRPLGAATVTLVLHGDGSKVTTALCAPEGRLPEELRLAAAELQPGPFALRDQEGLAATRAATALAWVAHQPSEIPSDHRWWSEISGLVMLGELMNEG